MLPKRSLEEIIGAFGGAAVGGTVGSMAGLLGAMAGAVIGAICGFGVGAAVDSEESRVSLHDRELDRVIGVEGGDMGSASQPPPAPPFDELAWYV